MISRMLQFVIAVLTFNGLVFALNLHQTLDNNEAEVASLRIRSHIYRTLGDLQDVETGHRGYAITGSEEFLEPFSAGVGKFPADIAVLKSLSRRNASLLGMAAELEVGGYDKIEYASMKVSSKRRQEADGGRDSIDGKRLMDRCRVAANRMLANQDSVLERQLRRSQQMSWFSVWTFLVCHMVVFLLAYWVLRLSRLQAS